MSVALFKHYGIVEDELQFKLVTVFQVQGLTWKGPVPGQDQRSGRIERFLPCAEFRPGNQRANRQHQQGNSDLNETGNTLQGSPMDRYAFFRSTSATNSNLIVDPAHLPSCFFMTRYPHKSISPNSYQHDVHSSDRVNENGGVFPVFLQTCF
jgi:hypothetical protein